MARSPGRRALAQWLVTGAGPWAVGDIDTRPGDVEAFRRENERAGLVRIRRLAILLMLLNGAAWLTDPWLLDPLPGVQPALAEGRFAMTIFGVGVLGASYLPPSAAVAVAWLAGATLCGGVAYTMGRIGGPSTSWFHSTYPFLFVALLGWAAPLHRLAIVTAFTGCVLAAYFGPHPAYLADPMAGSAIVHLLLTAALVLAVGLGLDRARLRLFLYGRAAGRASARLEARVAEQTGHIQALLDRAETAREDERRELAAELHDETGQVLTGMRLVLRAARGRAEREGSPLAPVLAQIAEMMQELGWTVRNLLVRLRPRVLDDLGFVAAAEWLAQRTDGLPGLTCAFEARADDAGLSAARATAAFRVLQEALTNAVRHAEASRITVTWDSASESRVLTVADDGRGFDPASPTAGLGLAGMIERARMCGGALAVRAAPGRGATIELTLPIETEEATEDSRGGAP